MNIGYLYSTKNPKNLPEKHIGPPKRLKIQGYLLYYEDRAPKKAQKQK